MSFQPEALAAVMNIYRVCSQKITFGKAEVMNGIQQIGFANSIASANANDAFIKLIGILRVIFELIKRYIF